MKRTSYYAGIAVIAATILIVVFVRSYRPPLRAGRFKAMGTFLTIKTERNVDIRAAYRRIKEIEGKLDRFDKKSEISRINSAKPGEKIPASSDTMNCIRLAIKVSNLTGGAFDITLSGRYGDISLDEENGTVSLLKPGMKLDLNGIAKGYAVEEARKLLFKRGAKSGIIDMRSSIALLSGPMTIGVADPFKKGETIGTITLSSGEALSSSGSYERGKHIMDPRTGQKAGELVHVTIKGSDAGLIDGLSTALFVMGTKEGMATAEKLDLPVILVRNDGEVFRRKL